MASKLNVYKNAPQKDYDLTVEQRDEYSRISRESRLAKLAAVQGDLESLHGVNIPKFKPELLMPKIQANGLRCLSLFSGGGGLDLGFDRAGYEHHGSFELIPICGETLRFNNPNWSIYSGINDGDVTKVEWDRFVDTIEVIHGGPPCQPFSIAGQQKGHEDERNMWGEFSRAVNSIKPRAFVAENVLGLLNPKFTGFIQKYILDQLQSYHITMFEMNSADFGVPQIRRRVFFVGFKDENDFARFVKPEPTHMWNRLKNGQLTHEENFELFEQSKPLTMGVREALGLPEIGFESLAPTLRSGFTGKRNTTSVLNSAAGQKAWGDLGIWPNGVQSSREMASAFPAKFGHFRLSVQDCGLLQGFPESWKFSGAVYQALGQIGNSVAPPVGYAVARSVAKALNVDT